MDFYVGRPGSDAVVGAESEAAAAELRGFEAGPGADAGGGSVGSDEPLVVDGFSGEGGRLVFPEDDRGVPGEADTEFGGALEEEAVESGAADSDARSSREVCGDGCLAGGEGDAGEFCSVMGLELDAEVGEGSADLGHEAFAAGFVDGRAEGVDEEDVGSALAEGYSGGEACGAGSGDEYVTAAVTHWRPFNLEGASRR